MLELNAIQERETEIIEALQKRNFDGKAIIQNVIQLNEDRKSTQAKHDDLLSQINSASKEIGQLFQSGNAEQANAKKEHVRELKEQSQQLGEDLTTIENRIKALLVQIPNAPHTSVPAGNSEDDNEELFSVSELPTLPSDAAPHWELTDQYNLIDFEAGVKIAGAGFPVYKGKGAQLQRALVNFFLAEANKAGYTEMQPPILVNEESGFGTGQLPDKEGQMYHVQNEDLYLIPTAEVPLTNMYRDEIIEHEELPIKLTGFTPCFRREAGSYGKDVRGLNRLHQFDKVELVQITHPSSSYAVLEEMKLHVEQLLQQLELPYRILRLCGGDLGFTSALTFDFETYSAAQKRWLEVSSVSNFETYQSNRMKIRYRPEAINGKKQKAELAHTLNGSALALPRILATLLENNQTKEGIIVPKVLQPYTGFDIIS